MDWRAWTIEKLRQTGVVVTPTEPPKICCPIHGERTPSCALYPDHPHCFGCGYHAGYRQFARDVFYGHIADEPLAYRALAEEAGSLVVVPAPPRASLTPRQAEAMSLLLGYARVWLFDSPVAMDYLASRAITKVGPLSWGYLPRGNQHRHTLEAAFRQQFGEDHRQVMLDVGLARVYDDVWRAGRMAGRIVIPALEGGTPRWYQGRAIDDHALRYLSPPRMPKVLFGQDTLVAPGPVVLCSGPFDGAIFWQAGMACLVTAGERLGEARLDRLVHSLRGRDVWVPPDNDPTGYSQAGRCIDAFMADDHPVHLLRVPSEFKDVNAWATARGPGEVLGRFA